MRWTGLLVFLAFGCSSGGAQVNITKSVGPEGGTVSNSDGSSLVIPMGALSSPANITMSTVEVTAPNGTVLVGPAWDIGPEGTTFATPVTITLPIDTSKIPTGLTAANVSIYTAPKGTTEYSQLFTTVEGNTVKTQTSHLSIYLPAAPAAACSPVCGPNSDGGCQCVATCEGKMQEVQCFGTTSVSCFCEIDHQTQSTRPSISSCEQIRSAYDQCFGGLP